MTSKNRNCQVIGERIYKSIINVQALANDDDTYDSWGGFVGLIWLT